MKEKTPLFMYVPVHEAAHAVVAAYLKLPFSHVTRDPKVIQTPEAGGELVPKPSKVATRIQAYYFNRKRGIFSSYT